MSTSGNKGRKDFNSDDSDEKQSPFTAAPPTHIVNGQHTAVGQKVHYINLAGQMHEATIDALNGDSADVSAHVDGRQQKFTGVPHNAAGGPNTWTHLPKA